MTEDDKKEIVERLTLEQELRRQMSGSSSEPKKKSPWEMLNSGFALLILTSIVSAVLVPQINRTNAREEWRRKTLAENAKYKLEMMRACLEKYTALGAADPQVMALFNDVRNETPLGPDNYKAFQTRLRALKTKRYDDVAVVRANLTYFRGSQTASDKMTEYIDQSAAYFNSITTYLEMKRKVEVDPTARAQGTTRLDNLAPQIIDGVKPLDKGYQEVLTLLLNEIHDQETRYEKLDF